MSSSAGDGAEGVIRLFPIIIWEFHELGLPTEHLFRLQRERISKLIACIQNERVDVSGGHYHHLEEIIGELMAHVAVLQERISGT